MMVDRGHPSQRRTPTWLFLVRVNGLQFQLVMVDPEVGWGRVQLFPQRTGLSLVIRLWTLLFSFHSSSATSAHDQPEDDGDEDDDAAGGEDGVLHRGRDSTLDGILAARHLDGSGLGPVRHHWAQRAVALAVPRLDLEVILGGGLELVDHGVCLVSDHALNHPLPVVSPSIHRVKDHIAVDSAIGSSRRQPRESD